MRSKEIAILEKSVKRSQSVSPGVYRIAASDLAHAEWAFGIMSQGRDAQLKNSREFYEDLRTISTLILSGCVILRMDMDA